VSLFLEELDIVLRSLDIQDDYDLLGHSWGGSLAGMHAARQSKGLKRLIFSSTLSDAPLWVEEQAKLCSLLPQDVQDALKNHEEAGTTDSQEYEDAVMVYNKHYMCRADPWPERFLEAFSVVEKDNTVYTTMWGKAEFKSTGNLKDFSLLDVLPKIKNDTLLTNGRYDEATDGVMEPFWRLLGGKVRWAQFANSAHLVNVEEKDRYNTIVGDFLCHED
jgi:L-proline amide hydrolase